MSFARQTTFWDYAAAQWPGEGWLPIRAETSAVQATPVCSAAAPGCADEGAVRDPAPVPRRARSRCADGKHSPVVSAAPLDPQRERRAMRGSMSYHAGRAAEAAVARHYQSRGRSIAAERWRCPYGEIDLIARDGEELVFIEVKQGPSHDAAILHLTPKQMTRILAAASVYLGSEPLGQATPVRFDVATVDCSGRIDIREAAFC